MDKQYDVVIIGGGPAGLTAAIYASRANLSTCIIEAEAPGGKLVKTYEIENYPGIRKLAGYELAMQLMEHGLSFGANMESAKVEKIENVENGKKITLTNGKELFSKTVIIASGTKERELDLPNAKQFTGHGISYCAVCDGAFYRNQTVTVIGGGNSALEEALYLTSMVEKINIVIRRDEFRAEASIQDRINSNPKINIVTNSVPESLVIEDNKVVGLNVKNVKTNEITKLDCTGIFPYIGADPSTDFVDASIIDEKGYLIVDANMATSIEGIYGAGDVIQKNLRQVVTATNDGAIAANSVIKYLQNKKN